MADFGRLQKAALTPTKSIQIELNILEAVNFGREKPLKEARAARKSLTAQILRAKRCNAKQSQHHR